MSGRDYAERNLPSFFANNFGPLIHFKVDCEAEELAQGPHWVSLMKDTGLEKDSPASSVPRVCHQSPTPSTSEVGLLPIRPRSDRSIPTCQIADLHFVLHIQLKTGPRGTDLSILEVRSKAAQHV